MGRTLATLYCLSASLLSGTLHAQWITGYFESQNGVQSVSQIPWNKYTHIVHFAATTGGTGDVQPHWLGQTEIQQIVAARPAGKKVLVCIQDNGSNTSAFANSASPSNIGAFVKNIVNFVNSNGYDGVDIDWEINVNATQEAALFQQLRAAMPDRLVTAAESNNSNMVSAVAASYSSLDQINVMCYDMDTPANGYSWYNDALLQNGNSSVMTCDWRVNSLLKAGVPASKIGIGLPFYGRRWKGVTKALVQGSYSTSTVFYKDLVTDATRWQPQNQGYDSSYKSDYLSISSLNEFESYTGAKTIADAAAWIKSSGFGGAMTFSLYYEFLAGQSGDARYPLSTALYQALGSSTSFTPTPPSVSGGQPSGTLASATTQATLSVVTDVNASCKYATAPGVPYSAMPNMFATTGGTASSTLVTGLSGGTAYNYYVRCADSAGNADTSDYTVSFSVAADPPAPAPAAPGSAGAWCPSAPTSAADAYAQLSTPSRLIFPYRGPWTPSMPPVACRLTGLM